ncbi:MAG: tetratricopeptide repeat protein [Dechloromonas sp.]|nr:tetratricopeptide repeat protein [Dechloromonas sp.]
MSSASQPKPCHQVTRVLRAAILGLAFAVSTPLFADTLADAQKQIRQGKFPQALATLDLYLEASPNDAQARFLKGVIYTETGKTDEAIIVFTKLTQDYPEFPEPYNNLAVLYARQKQYEKARMSLEMAIQAHPSYATAYENLGDLYARQASDAYGKAAQLDGASKSAKTKQALSRELTTLSPKAGGKTTTDSAAARKATNQ